MIADSAECSCPKDEEIQRQDHGEDGGDGIAGSNAAEADKIGVGNHERARQREIAA